MHGWRHFFNTPLLMANVSDSNVMSLTGHLTEESKKRYTHFDTTMFMEVVDVQEKLLATKRQRTKSAAALKKPRKSGTTLDSFFINSYNAYIVTRIKEKLKA
jgi:hypothetical protein